MRKKKMGGNYLEPNKEIKFGGMKYQSGGEYPTYKKDSSEAKSFREAFAEARKGGKTTFKWEGRSYGTRRKDETKEQHAASMKKAAGASKPKASNPAPGTTPPGTPKKAAPARTTPTGGSGMGAKQREDALKAEIDSAKPKAKAKPAPKKTGASDLLKQSEFQSSKEAAKSPNSAATVAKFFGATKVNKGKKSDKNAPSAGAEAKKEAKGSKKAISAKSAAKKITDRTNRQAGRRDKKIERGAAKNERQYKRLDRKAARYDRKIDSNTGISKRELNKDARKAKRADVKAAGKNATASAAAAAAARKRAMGDAVEKDLKKRGLGYGGAKLEAAGLRPVPKGNTGLPKLGKSVRNKMGFHKRGGRR